MHIYTALTLISIGDVLFWKILIQECFLFQHQHPIRVLGSIRDATVPGAPI